MLLRLLMPPYDRMIRGGTIIKWHRAEGEPVDYGDDLVDIQIKEIQATKNIYVRDPKQWLHHMARHLKTTSPDGTAPILEPASAHAVIWDAHFVLRVNSSDRGLLQRIHVQEGQCCNVGDVLALLTTEEGESWIEGEPASSDTALFRAVANVL